MPFILSSKNIFPSVDVNNIHSMDFAYDCFDRKLFRQFRFMKNQEFQRCIQNANAFKCSCIISNVYVTDKTPSGNFHGNAKLLKRKE